MELNNEYGTINPHLFVILIKHCRFFKHLLLLFLVQQIAAGMFRVISGICRTMIIANTGGSLMLLIFLEDSFFLSVSH